MILLPVFMSRFKALPFFLLKALAIRIFIINLDNTHMRIDSLAPVDTFLIFFIKISGVIIIALHLKPNRFDHNIVFQIDLSSIYHSFYIFITILCRGYIYIFHNIVFILFALMSSTRQISPFHFLIYYFPIF